MPEGQPEGLLAKIGATIYEPQLRRLPEYGKLLFDHLCVEYTQAMAQQMTSEERSEIERIKQARQENRLAWDDIYRFQKILAQYLAEDDVIRKIKTLRAQYRNIAGAKEYDIYLASKPPDLETANEIGVLRQDCQYLLHEFFLRYSLLSAREHMRNNLLKLIALMAVVTLVIGGVVTAINFSERLSGWLGWGYGVTTLAVVMFAGVVGALISMQQRVQSAPSEGDPIYVFSMLTHGRFGIFLSPISGAIFSVVLYLMFTGGLLSGKIFPTIRTLSSTTPATNSSPAPTPAPSSSPTPTITASPTVSATVASAASSSAAAPRATVTPPPALTPTVSPVSSPSATPAASPAASTSSATTVTLNDFLRGTGPDSGIDYALLVIWAFIAGFAERFVPDALNRLVARNEAKTSS